MNPSRIDIVLERFCRLYDGLSQNKMAMRDKLTIIDLERTYELREWSVGRARRS